MMEKIVFELVTLFVVLDPIGMLAIFLAIATDLEAGSRRTLALRAVLYAYGVLVFFIVAGELLLIEMGIPLRAFQIAGGILLLLYGIDMTLGSRAPGTELAQVRDGGLHSLAVYPLAVPAIAGPGAMLTVVLLTDNRVYGIGEQAITAAVLAAVLALFLLILLLATPITRTIGAGGANILRRVMGILLCAVAVNMVAGAIQGWLDLPPL